MAPIVSCANVVSVHGTTLAIPVDCPAAYVSACVLIEADSTPVYVNTKIVLCNPVSFPLVHVFHIGSFLDV